VMENKPAYEGASVAASKDSGRQEGGTPVRRGKKGTDKLLHRTRTWDRFHSPVAEKRESVLGGKLALKGGKNGGGMGRRRALYLGPRHTKPTAFTPDGMSMKETSGDGGRKEKHERPGNTSLSKHTLDEREPKSLPRILTPWGENSRPIQR